ncbi:MAG: glycoside hydrolase family 25 protein [Candidatus Limnocylindrales bacterium]
MPARSVVVLLLVALALSAGGLSPAATAARGGPKPAPSSSLEGLDVSQWQGTIAWSRVASAGKRFAFIRASAGSLSNDPRYVANRAGAKAAGLKVGAYHFANPDSKPGDALAEADFFLSLATPAQGDLLPVLDLEVNNGLSTADLQAWAMTWLERVRSKLGVRAMIYSSPNFWQTQMGDTTAFAAAGYQVLWIANWGVKQPTVPAANWDGKGWTFWQYSSCGSVSGIGGCVDLDRYHGLSLATYLLIP